MQNKNEATLLAFLMGGGKKLPKNWFSQGVCLKNETLYGDQILAAKQVFAMLNANRNCKNEHRRSPLVFLQPQCGKTGVITAVVWAWIKDAIRRKKRFQVVILCGLPHLDLLEQTRGRLRADTLDGKKIGAQLHSLADDSGYAEYAGRFDGETLSGQGILVINNNRNLRTLDLNNGVEIDERLIVVDEVHLGNNKNGCLHEFLANHGVFVGQQIHTWDTSKGMNFLVAVSATPFAHMAAGHPGLGGDALYTTIYSEPPATYNGIENMFQNNRMRQAEALFDGNKPTKFFLKMLEDFHSVDGAGYFMMRVGTKPGLYQKVLDFINDHGKIEVKEFNSDLDNIPEMIPTLHTRPDEKIVVLIKGTMRAGVTLAAGKHFIQGWYEGVSFTVDAHAQSGVGRSCGHGKNDETYPIYCELDTIKEVRNLYKDALESPNTIRIPAGRQNYAVKNASGGPFGPYPPQAIWNVFKAIPYVTERRGGKGKNKAQLSATGPETLYDKNGNKVRDFTGNNRNDIALFILQGRRDNNSTLGYYVNGPPDREAFDNFKAARANTKNPLKLEDTYARRLANYNLLVKMYPHWVGKVVMIDPNFPIDERKNLRLKPLKKEAPHRDTAQKKSSALRSDSLLN